MRQIDADSLWKKAEEMYIHTKSGKIIPVMAVPVWAINNTPTIKAEPVRYGEWISVKEQMPPTGNAVLVVVHNANMSWWCVEVDIWDGKWLDNPDSEWHIVTHWMPLPELPDNFANTDGDTE